MDNHLIKKIDTPDFSRPDVQKAFIDEAHTSADLIRKEIEVNLAEQGLLKKRIEMMRSFVNDLPASDPQYSMLLSQIQADEVEIIELSLREKELASRLESP